MELDITINGEVRRVKMLSHNHDNITLKVDDKVYRVDVSHTSKHVYSVLVKQKSYNIETAPDAKNPKKYFINCGIDNMTAELTDSQTRYAQSRTGTGHVDDNNVLQTPMPGKIVKLMVEENQEVKKGQTLVVIEAMKMQSEYKASGDKKIKKILVKEGDVIEGNQPLIMLE